MSASSLSSFSAPASSRSASSSSASSTSTASRSSSAAATAHPSDSASDKARVAARAQTSDPKTWPLGRYFWATLAYARKEQKICPYVEFFFDGTRHFTLRIDNLDPTQFLLCSLAEADAFLHPETGEPRVVDDSTPDDELPCSRWHSYGFDTIVDDKDSETGETYNGFGCEIEGTQQGIGKAVDIVCRIFAETKKEKSIVDAVIVRWHEHEKTFETDRRYSDVDVDRVNTMHTRGTPHDSTVLYSQCGRLMLLMLRTVSRVVQIRAREKEAARRGKNENDDEKSGVSE